MPRPTMHPVESSNVSSIGHDGQDMHVAYKSGGIYVYKDVPVATFQAARAAKSVGGYIHDNVRDRHETEKLPEDDAGAAPESIDLDRLALIVCKQDGEDIMCAQSCSGCRNTVRELLAALRGGGLASCTVSQLYDAIVLTWKHP